MRAATTPHARWNLPRAIAKLAIATICGAAAGYTVFIFSLSAVLPSALGQRDFVAYWAAGRQLALHANPYDQEALARTEHSVGFPAEMRGHNILFMRNPPWTLPLVYPLGLLGPQAASMLWSLFLVACLAVSIRLLWIMHGRPRGDKILLAYTFAPALVCLINAQVAPIALLGLVLFLRLHHTRPFIAGAALWLCSLKPHLFLPFGAVFVGWVVVSRSYKLLAGAGAACALNFAVAYRFDPMAWIQYERMIRTSGIERNYIACLSFLLRARISPGRLWIQFLPAAVGCVWALLYFWPRRHTWDWMKDGSLLMLVSLVAAPYSWLFDQTLAIPALLQGIYRTRSRGLLAALALASALVEVALYFNSRVPSALYLWTLWTAPAWLVWYLAASASSSDPWRGRAARAFDRFRSRPVGIAAKTEDGA
jgi:hypothetical protein